MRISFWIKFTIIFAIWLKYMFTCTLHIYKTKRLSTVHVCKVFLNMCEKIPDPSIYMSNLFLPDTQLFWSDQNLSDCIHTKSIEVFTQSVFSSIKLSIGWLTDYSVACKCTDCRVAQSLAVALSQPFWRSQRFQLELYEIVDPVIVSVDSAWPDFKENSMYSILQWRSHRKS